MDILLQAVIFHDRLAGEFRDFFDAVAGDFRADCCDIRARHFKIADKLLEAVFLKAAQADKSVVPVIRRMFFRAGLVICFL